MRWVLILIMSISLVGCATSEVPVTNPQNPSHIADVQNREWLQNYPSVADNSKGEQSTQPPENKGNNTENKTDLIVSFIDVGQADSALIRIPNGTNILIDAGNNADEEFLTDYLEKLGIEEISILIGTHPHEDHIGGMDKIIENFKIDQVIMPKVTTNTKNFEDVLLAIQEKGLKIKEGKAGVQLDIGQLDEELPPVSAKIIAPLSNGYEDMNNYSIVLRLEYGSHAFLFTGDAEDVSEEEMLAANAELRADILKVGHHGSNSSTTPNFLKAVDPKHGIISVGKDNSYGHPTEAVLKRLGRAGIAIYRTDQLGTITITTNGATLNISS